MTDSNAERTHQWWITIKYAKRNFQHFDEAEMSICESIACEKWNYAMILGTSISNWENKCTKGMLIQRLTMIG